MPLRDSHSTQHAMTDSRAAAAQGRDQPAPALAPTPELYPQYCFHLSPTINKWCHLRAADIVALSSHPGFQGQDLYFHLNHPIKWVRICGIVVAIDVYGDAASRKGRVQVVTIDDSSGETMECVIQLPSSPLPPGQHSPAQQQQQQQKSAQSAHTLPQIDGEIDIGHTLDIKGSLRTFRNQRQLKVEKIVHLKTTEQEVAFWGRVVQLRREVLDKPWKLEEKVVRRLRRDAMGVDGRDDAKKRERVKEKEEARKERKRMRRLQLLEEEQRVREVEGRGKNGKEAEGVKKVEVGAEVEEKEKKRMRRLAEERRARELAAKEEEILKRKAAEELEEREKEMKRMKRLEEERKRLEKEKKAEGESEVTFASEFTTARQAQVVIPTRTKRNVTGLERRMPMSRTPIPPRPKEPTGLERKSKSSRSVSSDRVMPVTGKYKALGL